MGCCFSSDEDKDYTDNDPTDRTPLYNPVSDGPASRQINNYNTIPSHQSQQKGDEQSALNRILHQTANNVIDVSAIDAHTMEQREYLDRARQYSIRVATACGSSHHVKPALLLPNGVAAPQVVLSGQPISLADIQLASHAAESAARAVQEIKVRHKEDLVVPFGVP